MSDTNINVLNDLIKVCGDGEKGFTAAAKDATIGQLRTLLERGAARCAQSARDLQALVRAKGGEPATGGSAAGALHRGWVEVRAKVAGNTDLAVLEECERGEDSAKKSYENALKETLASDVRQVIERQHQGVIANHDEIRRMRDEFKDDDMN